MKLIILNLYFSLKLVYKKDMYWFITYICALDLGQIDLLKKNLLNEMYAYIMHT